MSFAHERPFAPVHDRIPYSPIVDRRPISWPGGATVAVWVVPNIEHYEYLPPPGGTDPYPRSPHPDVQKFAYHDYGNRVGFWRLLEALDRYAIPCTASVNVAVLDHYPQIGQAMADRSWDLMSHGMYNTRYLTGMAYEEQRAFLDACNDVLVRHTGRRFTGMVGPNITGTWDTPDVMADAGMRYHAEWVHDERPSPLRNSAGTRLVALPYSYELNDAPLLMRSHVDGDEYVELCRRQLERLRQEAGAGGRMMCLPLHPFAIGQPHRAAHLDRLLRTLREHDDVWVTTASEIVDHYVEHHYDEDLAGAGGRP